MTSTSQPGVRPTGSVLDRIVADKREALELRKRTRPLASFETTSRSFDEQWPLRSAIKAGSRAPNAGKLACQVIAEIKKASPSKGAFVTTLDHVAIARAYAAGGATAISIVTEANHFQGNIEWLRDVRIDLQAKYPGTRPALLRKDFLFDPYELAESRAYGADAVLLIVAMLDDALLHDLLRQAPAYELEALVEVHNEEEAERAVGAGATLFGINNRDLHTFEVDLATTERLRPLLPRDAVVVGESGVHTRADVIRLHAAGVDAILVGESLMLAPDVAAQMRDLML